MNVFVGNQETLWRHILLLMLIELAGVTSFAPFFLFISPRKNDFREFTVAIQLFLNPTSAVVRMTNRYDVYILCWLERGVVPRTQQFCTANTILNYTNWSNGLWQLILTFFGSLNSRIGLKIISKVQLTHSSAKKPIRKRMGDGKLVRFFFQLQ